MTYFKLILKNSPVHGKGLFAGEDIPKGKLVINWMDEDVKLITEQEHLKMIASSKKLSQSSIRLTGNIFLYGDELGDTDYINHSDHPSLIYQAGLCYSLRDIKEGEEVSLDYRFLNSEHEHDVVTGYSAEKAMLLTVKKLLELFQ